MKNYTTNKKSTISLHLGEILAILPTHELIILTKFDDDWTKIADVISVVYFWASVILF